ncbi:MAG: T9SS type A sorting domain-containing protein, partial [Bacteroidales bacterium]|nr:T9SS type A sorting domain-containing protein [Bacteroidales bacterium]
ERNTGRASVMAKGVLCFFHGICYEDEWDDAGAHAGAPQQGDDTTGTRAKRTAMDTDNDATLSVYPNPTDDILFIELSGGAGIANMALYDLQGRVVGTRFIASATGASATGASATGASATGASATGASATVNMRDIPAGVYVLRVTDTDGNEYHQKIVRK